MSNKKKTYYVLKDQWIFNDEEDMYGYVNDHLEELTDREFVLDNSWEDAIYEMLEEHSYEITDHTNYRRDKFIRMFEEEDDDM